MSFEDQNPAAEPIPVQPKTLTPYRHKLQKSAMKIARAMSGVEGLSQADQTAAFQFVLNELRKMAGGASKGLELSQSRDYDAYKTLKAKVKAGIPLDQAGALGLDPETASEFQILMASLGQGTEYSFDADEVDPAGEQAAAFQEKKNTGTEGGQSGDVPSFD